MIESAHQLKEKKHWIPLGPFAQLSWDLPSAGAWAPQVGAASTGARAGVWAPHVGAAGAGAGLGVWTPQVGAVGAWAPKAGPKMTIVQQAADQV